MGSLPFSSSTLRNGAVVVLPGPIIVPAWEAYYQVHCIMVQLLCYYLVHELSTDGQDETPRISQISAQTEQQ